MKKKQIIKNITISIIIGIILGSITEIALILNISWLIRITQSFMFWGIVMCICAIKELCIITYKFEFNYNFNECHLLYNQINKIRLY